MHNHECLYPLRGVRQTRFGQKLFVCFLSPVFLSPLHRPISVSSCYLSLSFFVKFRLGALLSSSVSLSGSGIFYISRYPT